MHIEFHGAAHEVTGACFLIECGGRRVLLDCGLIQGTAAEEARNRDPFPFNPASLDAVVLSHAHLDHSGRLPLLVRQGFRGPIYTHRASRDLCRILLKDAAMLNLRDTENENRKRARKGLKPVTPLYEQGDADAALRRIRAIDYGVETPLTPGVRVRLHDAGHILGSAIVELTLEERGATRTLVYSGDLGHRGAPILRDPVMLKRADLVLLESTYGDRNHRSWEATWRELGEVLTEAAAERPGNVLIPAFAVGRTQELLFVFQRHFQEWNLDRWQIFLDSPMAIEATELYARHTELFDREATALNHHGKVMRPANLHISRTANQSMAINRIQSGAIIIAGSGMCDGGRIRHHLKHNLWRENCHVVFVGFQAQGTLGRRLVDGAQHVRLWGETVRVAARIHTIGGLSAHADQQGLLDWYGGFEGQPPVALVHGEPAAIEALGRALGPKAWAPLPGEHFHLLGSG